jgi:hypothetical protein
LVLAGGQAMVYWSFGIVCFMFFWRVGDLYQ